jgi:hypothetical protein
VALLKAVHEPTGACLADTELIGHLSQLRIELLDLKSSLLPRRLEFVALGSEL